MFLTDRGNKTKQPVLKNKLIRGMAVLSVAGTFCHIFSFCHKAHLWFTVNRVHSIFMADFSCVGVCGSV